MNTARSFLLIVSYDSKGNLVFVGLRGVLIAHWLASPFLSQIILFSRAGKHFSAYI